jgi:hypothetical protein
LNALRVSVDRNVALAARVSGASSKERLKVTGHLLFAVD